MTRRLLAAAVFFAALNAGEKAHAQAAQVLIPSTVTLNIATRVYTYSYSVTDATTMDLAIVTVPAARGSMLLNLTAPAGFNVSFDPGVGLVSFFEDNNPATTGSFTSGSTVTGFSFTSLYGPGTVTYDALDVSGTDYTGQTMSATAAVPEPATTALLAGGLLLAGGVYLRRRHAAQQPSVQ